MTSQPVQRDQHPCDGRCRRSESQRRDAMYIRRHHNASQGIARHDVRRAMKVESKRFAPSAMRKNMQKQHGLAKGQLQRTQSICSGLWCETSYDVLFFVIVGITTSSSSLLEHRPLSGQLTLRNRSEKRRKSSNLTKSIRHLVALCHMLLGSTFLHVDATTKIQRVKKSMK